MRFCCLILLLVTACSAHAPEVSPPAPAGEHEIWEHAMQWQRDGAKPLADPSFQAAQDRAVALANLAHRAARERMGLRARQLAIAADRTRDELLSCRQPLWEVGEPIRLAVGTDQSEAAFVSWLRTHQRELLAGRDTGFIASQGELRTAISFIDTLLDHTDGRDDLLYLAPGLRDHRGFLQRELLPHASDEAGVDALPSGSECHAALARSALGISWDLTEVRSIALNQLERTPPTCRAATAAWPDEAAEANRRKSGVMARGFQPSPATGSAWGVYLHRFGEATRAEWVQRHPALLSSLALGALFELNVHTGSWSLPEAVEFGQQFGCDPARSAALYRDATRDPFTNMSQLVGYLSLQQLRTSVASELGAAFDGSAFNTAVVEAGALPPELLQSAVRQRLGLAP